ncbi:MAG TPA: hypothetical protein RMH99_24350 [Sandaracinaceae bacterium LLY-WYZ-13_1]|nr:hypothetical protein [Sandaracinaceae bacterium LLY-WYZ-13_1]
MRSRFSAPAVACLVPLAVLLASCDGTISVTFATGPQVFDVTASALELPTELMTMDGTIDGVECGPMGMCPPGDVVTLTCEEGVCDPAPRTLSAPVGMVVDVEDLLAETREVGLRVVDTYDVEAVEYTIQRNTLSVPIGEVEVYWGPEAATTIESPEVHRFGTLPAIAAGEEGSGQMAIDPAGEAALSDYLVAGGDRPPSIRFFARTRVDLDPGDPWPSGDLRVGVNVTVRAVGSVVD